MTYARRTLAFTAALSLLGGVAVAAPATTGPLTTTPVTAQEEDASLRLGLVPYAEIGPRLAEIEAQSDRMTTEVIGTSVDGRDLYMVTLTAPQSKGQEKQQDRMRERIRHQPAQAARDNGLARKYRLPVFINGNIHGNEWEGTDAILRFVEEYATSQDPAVTDLLETTRLHLVVTANPDGRVDNHRANAVGFDLNRDMATATQPESIALRDVLLRTQPAMLIDLHGYVNGTLVEPTTAPHGEAYENDLLLKHSYPNALSIEQAILDLGYGDADGVRDPQIPLRDWDEGWDGWPPIFVPQYAALHGAVAHTIEVPLRVNNASYDLDEAELQRRSAINTDVAHAAIMGTMEYVSEHRAELLADHIEIFRRGVAGEEQRPVEDGLFGVVGPEDVYLTDYPRAYLIRTDGEQRSAPAAARLVEFLVENDVEVGALRRDTTLNGVRYPEGTYLVDMHQAKRAVAQTFLGPGTDISDRVDAMYDISGWSHSLLWGADVETLPADADVKNLSATAPVTHPADTADLADLADGSAGWLLPMQAEADVRALTTLLDQGVPVEQLEDGSVLIPADYPWAAGNVAESYGVTLADAGADASGAVIPRSALQVGVAGAAQERWMLDDLGFEVTQVSTDALNEGLSLAEVDTLFVSSGLNWDQLDEEARAELQAFAADGGGVVGRGTTAARVNDALDLLDVEHHTGRRDANGVVRVEPLAGSPITDGAPEHSFIYGPSWFDGLGEDVRADMTYGEDPMAAGHWRPSADGGDGPADAAGQPAVVSGESADGARVVLFGTDPLFRAHPKGLFAQIGRSLVWTATD